MRALDQVWIGRINRALADKTWSSEIVKNTQSSVTIRPFPLYFNKICRPLFPIDTPCTSCCVFHASSLCFPGPTFSAFFIISHCIYSPTHSPITRPFLVRFSRGFFRCISPSISPLLVDHGRLIAREFRRLIDHENLADSQHYHKRKLWNRGANFVKPDIQNGGG